MDPVSAKPQNIMNGLQYNADQLYHIWQTKLAQKLSSEIYRINNPASNLNPSKDVYGQRLRDTSASPHEWNKLIGAAF
jgi:hypothetical protein